MTTILELAKVRKRAQIQLLVWPFAIIVLLLQFTFGSAQMPIVLTESLIVFVGGEMTIVRLVRNGFWAPASLFYITLSVFHIGLVVYWIFHINPGFTVPSDYVWFDGPLGIQALVLCLAGMASYVLGVVLFVSLRPVADKVDLSFSTTNHARHLSLVGSVLTLIGVVWWFAIGVRAGGWAIFTGSYIGWLNATQSSTAISYVYVIIGVGIGLTVIAPIRGLAVASIVVFGLFAIVAFLLGLRGEVLFPIAVAASVLAYRRRMPRTAVALLAIFIVLVSISVERVIRQLGVGSASFDWSSANPLDALGELGQTIRVVAVVLQWHELQGDPYMHGATYTVSIVRLLEAVFDPAQRPDATLDFRLMNSEVAARAGSIGGSIIAEAFHNFAVPGVVVILALVGILFAYFSNMHVGAMKVGVYVVVGLPMFNHVRNSFVPVLPGMLLGLVLLVLIRSIGNLIIARSRL